MHVIYLATVTLTFYKRYLTVALLEIQLFWLCTVLSVSVNMHALETSKGLGPSL
jgi:hypothetical protein